MNLDILSKLPFLGGDVTEGESVDEVDAKAERIRYHREHVRNGPVKMRHVTPGMERRFRDRTTKSMMRKNRRRQVRSYFADQREAATLRGNLQAVGIIGYGAPVTVTGEQALRATIWLVRNHATGEGQIEVTEQVVRDAFQNALTRWGAIVGVPNLKVPEDYVLPVALAS